VSRGNLKELVDFDSPTTKTQKTPPEIRGLRLSTGVERRDYNL